MNAPRYWSPAEFRRALGGLILCIVAAGLLAAIVASRAWRWFPGGECNPIHVIEHEENDE